MGLKYIDHNGTPHDIAGLTPGGDLEYGAVATRQGTFSVPATNAGSANQIEVTFSEPMPDADYAVTFDTPATGNDFKTFEMLVFDKTASGFHINAQRNNSTATTISETFNYIAFKLYSVQYAEQNHSDILDIQSYIPATTSDSNKLVNNTQMQEAIENVDTGQFVGTTAEWNALPLADKVQYTTAIFTDDDDYVGNIVDAVTDGEMSAVTSNAVYDITNNPYPRGYAEITVSNDETYGDALTRLYNATDLSKVTCQSKLVHLYVNGSMEIMTIRNIVPGSNYLRFYSIVENQQGTVTIYNVAPASSGSTAYHIKLTTGGNQITSDATAVITDGRSLRIVY